MLYCSIVSELVSCRIGAAVRLALAGAFDGRIVDICDDVPPTIYELVHFVGRDMDELSEPMPDL